MKIPREERLQQLTMIMISALMLTLGIRSELLSASAAQAQTTAAQSIATPQWQIDAGGKIDACEIERFLPQNFRVLRQCDRMEVYDAVKAFVFFLQSDPIFERT